jgi:hypothetical protein
MKFNICIIQPKGYIHSMAFWELAELLLYSLRDLKHEACIQFNSIDTGAKNIIIGFHLLDISYSKQLPKDTILINTEQVLATHWNNAILAWIEFFEIWDYSTQNIDVFKSKGQANIKHLNIGYQTELNRITCESKKDIDVLFYGHLNTRRSQVINALKMKGLNISLLNAVYGKPRDEYIARSKIVLNLHYYESQIFELIRVFYLLSNGIPVVGEVNPTTCIPEQYRNAVKEAKYDDLAYACKLMVENKDLQEQQAKKGLEVIKKFPQSVYTAELL